MTALLARTFDHRRHRSRRRGGCTAMLVVLLIAATGCVPSDPRLPPSLVGLRVDAGGGLAAWTGEGCTDVRWLRIEFAPDEASSQRTRWTITADSKAGAPVETFVVGEPVAGFHTTTALPAGFDWRDFRVADVVLYDEGVARAHLSELASDTGAHGPDKYYFDGQGWFDRAHHPAAGEDFTTPCAS